MNNILISIIGSVNVGKSSLVNYFTNMNISITSSEPITTRNNMYGLLLINKYKIPLVDTAAIIYPFKTSFEKKLYLQSINIIKKSSIVILMIDVTCGLTSIDFHIINIVRKLGKKIIVVINKIELSIAKYSIDSFYDLNIKNIFKISIKQGMGIKELIICIKKILINSYFSKLISISNNISSVGYVSQDNDLFNNKLKISIIGQSNVGKSTFINKISGVQDNLVSSKKFTTTDPIISKLIYKGYNLSFSDTAGIKKNVKLKDTKIERLFMYFSIDTLKMSDLVIFMTDIDTCFYNENKKIIKIIQEYYKPIIILINKCDLIKNKNFFLNKLMNESIYTSYIYIPILLISSIRGNSINSVLEKIFVVHKNYYKRIKTSELNKTIKNAVFKRPHVFIHNKAVKIFFIQQVKTAPPEFHIFTNISFNFIKKIYQKYLINEIYKVFNIEGVTIKIIYFKK